VESGRAGVNQICRLFGISKKNYYASRSPSERLQQKYGWLKAKLEAIIEEHGSYGYRRLQVALLEHYAIRINHKLLRKLLRLWSLSLARREQRPQKSYVRRVLDFLQERANLLYRYQPTRAFEVLHSDITEIPFAAGKAYLAVHLDSVGKAILGWKLALRSDAALVVDSFKQARQRIRRLLGYLPKLIQHQDRGSVYTGARYVSTVRRSGCYLSYSRTGEPGDNAVNEAFFSRLKQEKGAILAEAQSFEQLQAMVASAIDYYNHRRYHSALNYRTPSAFIKDYLASLPRAG
jgi:transposase InsO family protein